MDSRFIYTGAQLIFAILFLTLMGLRHFNERNRGFDKLDLLYILFIIVTLLDATWMLINGKPEYRSWHVALEVTYLTCMAFTGYVWFLYTLDYFPAKSMKIRKYRYVLCIPVIIVVILVFISIKTSWMFMVDENGLYIRGEYHIYSVIVNYSYMLLGSYVALRCRRDALLAMDRRRFTVAALFPVPILLLSGLQLLLPPGLPAMEGSVFISLLLLFGTSQNVLITRDYLTGLPNRAAFEQDLLERIDNYRKDGQKHLYLLAGDLDKFKDINDTYGHPKGDKALQLTAQALSEVCEPYGIAVFRTGGDEFMMIAEAENAVGLATLQETINARLDELTADEVYDLNMSLGMVEYDGTINYHLLIEQVDECLYSSKEQCS